MTNIDPKLRIKDTAEVERRIGEIISEDFSISNDPIALDDDSHTIDLLDDNEPNSALPSDEWFRESIAEAETRRKRRKVSASLLVGLLVAPMLCALFWCGGGNSSRYRIVVDVLAVAWLSILCTLELKTKRLPNVLTLGGLALWLALGFASGGVGGLLAGGKAAGVGLLVALVPFLFRSMGAGAVKMAVACCAYVGWGRLLPFGVLCVMSGVIMSWGVCVDRYWNRAAEKAGTSFPCSLILAVATLAVIMFKWIGWVA